ncbi:IclR family transcriptional regulator C-terminal domain-containing protein, partial [Thermus sp.]|uniref:IclR family transcriptional regulator n=1 Tax=Thermus sp. TaxID=275 RepID=UPI00321FA06F
MAQRRSRAAVQTALEALAYLAAHPEGVGAKELARHLGRSLSAAYALLNSLVEAGFAVKGERGYRPTPGFPFQAPAPAYPLEEALEEVYLRTGERSYLLLLGPEGPRLRTRGRQGQPHPLGESFPPEWHALALGKVLLAFGPFPLPPLTPKTPFTLTDPEALEAELRRVRESGLAVEMEEYALGVSGIAAPLFDPEGRLLGAIGVKVPARRFPFAFPRLAQALLEVARVTPHLRPEAPAVRLSEATRPLEPPAPLEAPEALRQRANLQDYARAYRESLRDPEGFFGGFAREFHWFRPWERAFDPETRLWFRGGLTSAALNALDRHLPERARQVALVVLDGEGGLSKWTYPDIPHPSSLALGFWDGNHT